MDLPAYLLHAELQYGIDFRTFQPMDEYAMSDISSTLTPMLISPEDFIAVGLCKQIITN